MILNNRKGGKKKVQLKDVCVPLIMRVKKKVAIIRDFMMKKTAIPFDKSR